MVCRRLVGEVDPRQISPKHCLYLSATIDRTPHLIRAEAEQYELFGAGMTKDIGVCSDSGTSQDLKRIRVSIEKASVSLYGFILWSGRPFQVLHDEKTKKGNKNKNKNNADG